MRYSLLSKSTVCLLSMLATILMVQGVSEATTHARDTFSRSVSGGWGKSDVGAPYEIQGTSGNFSVANGRGNIRLAAARDGGRAFGDSKVPLNLDITSNIRTDKKATGYGQMAFLTTRRIQSGTSYDGRVRFAGDGGVYLQALRTVSGNESYLGSEVRVPNLTHNPYSDVRVRVQLLGSNPTTIRMKAWSVGQGEPSSWTYSTTDSTAALQQPGSLGMRAALSGDSTNAPVTLSFDDYTAGDVPRLGNWGIQVRDTAYSVPSSNVRFVSNGGSDSASGTRNAPWRTIGKAVSASPTGTTIVVRQGVYRESVSFYNKKLTIQPFPHEQVWMNGSNVVTGWQAEGGNVWRKDGWTSEFRQGNVPSNYVSSSHPLAAYPDMIFINGQSLRQVANRSQVTSGTFFADYSNNRLYIGSSPYGKSVESSVRSQAMVVNRANGTTVRGIGFTQYATHSNQHGMVKGDASGLRFENNTFARSASTGLSILGTDAIVRNNDFLYNGQMGLQGYKAHRMLVENNVIRHNNQERFAVTGSAGGMKVTVSNGNVWRGNIVEHNIGHGLWGDIDSYNTNIVNNTVRDNENNGIAYEISSKSIVASNLLTGNGQNGIFVNESRDVDVYNNTLLDNGQNIRVWEGTRAYNISDVVIRNNVMQGGGDRGLLGVVSQTNQISASDMGVTSNYNAYYRKTSTAPVVLSEWAKRGTVARYNSLSQFKADSGSESNAVGSDSTQSTSPFVNESQGNYDLVSGSSASNNGAPLPYAIAVAVGAQPNAVLDRGKIN